MAATAGRGGAGSSHLPHRFEHGLPEVRESQNQFEVDATGFHDCMGRMVG